MKTYVRITGALFGVLALVHVWRIVQEGHRLGDPVFLALTVASAALAIWAWRLQRR